MQQRSYNNGLAGVAKAGFAGVCSIYLVFFGFFLAFVGIILTATSYDSSFQSDFFADSNRGKRIAGYILLALSIAVLSTGVVLCCYVCKTVKKASNSNSQPGAVLNATPLVSGHAPPVSGYHTSQQAYPQAGGQLPYYPQGAAQPYAPPPQHGYAPPPQPYAPSQPYAPQQPYAPSAPPAQYPPAGYPSADYPPAGVNPGAPPPSYNDVATGDLPPKAGYP